MNVRAASQGLGRVVNEKIPLCDQQCVEQLLASKQCEKNQD